MVTKAKKKKVARKASQRLYAIPGLSGVRIVSVRGERKLELRSRLDMARDNFGRLVDVSVRTIAAVESTQKKVKKLQRNYVEVARLCDALSEVVDESCLRDWFLTSNDALDGFKPLEIIERGEIDRLWDMVYRLRSGIPV